MRVASMVVASNAVQTMRVIEHDNIEDMVRPLILKIPLYFKMIAFRIISSSVLSLF